MRDRIGALAARLRALRESAGLTPAALAADLGVSPAVYRRYENGAADIPVGFLYRAAARLGVELPELLTGENPRLHLYSLTRRGKGPVVERRRQYRYENLAAHFLHKRAEPFLVTVDPRPADEPAPLASHPGQEFDYLLAGRLAVTIGRSHEVVLKPGDALFFDAGVEHGMRALGGRPARFLAVIL